MRLELDLNDRNALMVQREELRRGLAVLEAAIEQMPKDGNGALTTPAVTPQRIRRDPGAIYAGLPTRFRISDILSMPQANINRPAARRAIDEWVESGSARLVEKVRGSAGNVYEKVTQ